MVAFPTVDRLACRYYIFIFPINIIDIKILGFIFWGVNRSNLSGDRVAILPVLATNLSN